jgi:hypothetical protein
MQVAMLVDFVNRQDGAVGGRKQRAVYVGCCALRIAVHQGSQRCERQRQRREAWAQAERQAGQAQANPQQGSRLGIQAGQGMGT